MKFKVGDKVVTTSGLCSGCIPVGAVGVVDQVISDRCVVVDFGTIRDKINENLPLGKGWRMFDEEIKVLV